MIKYGSLGNVKDHYKETINISKKLHNICVHNNENDEEVLIENTFFNLYTYFKKILYLSP